MAVCTGLGIPRKLKSLEVENETSAALNDVCILSPGLKPPEENSCTDKSICMTRVWIRN